MSHSNAKFAERELLLMLADISGALVAVRGKTTPEVASFFNDFYILCEAQIAARDGRVVKYLGDSALALFEPGQATAALDAADAIRSGFAAVCEQHATSADVRVNLHQGDVVHGQFGPQGREDVLGATVNTLFTLPSSPGLTISERVYRQLPSEARSPWHKRKTPVVYHKD